MADVEEIEVPDEERRSAWQKLVRELIRAVRRWIAAIFGGSFEELRGDVGTAKRVAAKAEDAGGQALVGAGHALDAGLRMTHGAARVTGQILGALVPRAAPGPIDVATAASAQDSAEARASADLRGAVRDALAPKADDATPATASAPALSPVELVTAAKEAVTLLQRGDAGASAALERLPPHVRSWLTALDRAALAVCADLPTGDLYRHLAGVATAAGLRPVPAPGAVPAPAPVISAAAAAEIVRRSLQSMAQSKGEIAAMAKRPGCSPRPRLPDEPLYGEEADRAFTAAPRPSAAY